MSKLAVRTRGNSSPQGKPRVYFSCYPDDFDKYFESLCGDIFATQNCAIYYESDWENGPAGAAASGKPIQESGPAAADHPAGAVTASLLASELADMQLFVVPLTTNFLINPCRARDFEYGFAMEHHIPILPIAMEEGIDQFFAECMNRIGAGFGDIQFLNKVSKDNTEISYEEKLNKLLDSILVGDDLAERVRAAFDAYIFLSYRKKDRYYAKELMKLIHRIPYCRDIAIWYDEFLVPGEGWNEAIREAMEKSSLVTLAVTPSVVEPDNFIINHEYPDAVSAGKEIVPAEMLPTDRDALARLFKGISNPVDGRDANAMEKALQSLAVETNDHVPEHNFLIGLAYLDAIDVERDPERAAALITSAAEAGLPEATRKLVSMYNTGEGVERNYITAVTWQERLVTMLEKTKEDPLADRDIFSALWDAGTMWQALGHPEQAEKAFARMEKNAEQREAQYHTASTCRDLAISYIQLGVIREAEKNLRGAWEYYEKALKIREELAAEIKTTESRQSRQSRQSRRDLWVSYNRSGGIREAEQDLSGARSYYEKARAIAEELAAETKTAETKTAETKAAETKAAETKAAESSRDLWVSYSKLGEISKAEKDFNGAQEYYEKALKIAEDRLEENETDESYRDLSVSYIKLGEIREAEQDLSGAREYYEKARIILEELAAATGTVESRRDLWTCYNKSGEIREMEQDLSGARSYYEKAYKIAEKLAAETKTKESRRDLFISYIKLGGLSEAEQDLHGAQAYYEKALEITEALAAEAKTAELRRDLSISYIQLGKIREAEQDLSSAREYYEKALKITEELAAETNTAGSLHDLSVRYIKLGGISQAEQDLHGARSYYEKACKIAEKLAAEIKTKQSRRDLWTSYNKLGEICETEQDLHGAREYYEKAFEIAEELATEAPTKQSRRDLYISYIKLGGISEAEQDLSGAREYYEKSLKIREELAAETKTPESRRDLLVSYYKLGGLSEAEQDLHRAREYYEKAYTIAEELVTETPTKGSRRDRYAICLKLGGISEAEQDLSGARKYYEKALEIDLTLTLETKTLESHRTLYSRLVKLGRISEAQQDLIGANTYYQKALMIADKVAKQTHSIQAYDDLGVSCYLLGRLKGGNKGYLQKAYDIFRILSENCPDNQRYSQFKNKLADMLR